MIKRIGRWVKSIRTNHEALASEYNAGRADNQKTMQIILDQQEKRHAKDLALATRRAEKRVTRLQKGAKRAEEKLEKETEKMVAKQDRLQDEIEQVYKLKHELTGTLNQYLHMGAEMARHSARFMDAKHAIARSEDMIRETLKGTHAKQVKADMARATVN